MKKVLCISTLLLVSACSSMGPPDTSIVAAEKLYERGIGTLNVVFTIEDTTETFLEAKIPGTHAAIEKVRDAAKKGMPAILNGIATYRKSGDKAPLDQALALVDQAILDAERILNPPPTLRRSLGIGEILALLSAGQRAGARR